MEVKESRKIPKPIKREVRQRCGFGCIICGIPLYEYDHMIEYSVVKEHKADNITLLCDMHHREKTNKLRTLEQVQKANETPYNIENKESSPYNFNFEGSNFEFKMGECELSINDLNPSKDYIIPFLVNNKKLISFEIINGQLFFNLVVFDKKQSLLLKIEENEMIYNTGLYDVEFVGTKLILREATKKIIFDIEFKIPNGVQINQGEFNCDGYQFLVKDGSLKSNNVQLFCKQITNFRIIFAVGEYDGKTSVVVRQV